MKLRNKAALLAAPLALSFGAAQAAVPTGVEAVFTGITTDFGTLLGYGYTAMGIVVAGMIVLALVKKVVKKSTSG